MTNLWFVNEDYPAACKSKICGQRPGRECIFPANASICSAKNARNDVHAVISDLSLALSILCQGSETWYPLDTRFPLHCSGSSPRRQLFHQLLTIYPISRKPLSAPKSFPSVTVQGFPAGNYSTKKCVLFKAAKQCYSNIAGRKQNKPKRPSQRRISQCTKTRFTP